MGSTLTGCKHVVKGVWLEMMNECQRSHGQHTVVEREEPSQGACQCSYDVSLRACTCMLLRAGALDLPMLRLQ